MLGRMDMWEPLVEIDRMEFIASSEDTVESKCGDAAGYLEDPGGHEDIGRMAVGLIEVFVEILTAKKARTLEDHKDIERAKVLIHEAVGLLSNSFNGLNQETRLQQQLVSSLIDQVSDDGSKQAADRITVKSVAEAMSSVLQYFVEVLTQVSSQSKKVISKMETMIGKINQTFTLLASVEKITKQTNLLSLNAFIEAARSGEAGSGFQVVATEMRSLSQNSAKLNEQIRAEVEKSRSIVDETQELVNQMALRDIDALVDAKNRADDIFAQLNDMNAHVASSLAEVSDIADQIDNNVGLAVRSLQFDDIVNQLLSHTEADLKDNAETLSVLESHVRGCIDAMHSGEIDCRDALVRLNDGLQDLKETVFKEKGKPVLQESMDAGDIELF